MLWQYSQKVNWGKKKRKRLTLSIGDPYLMSLDWATKGKQTEPQNSPLFQSFGCCLSFFPPCIHRHDWWPSQIVNQINTPFFSLLWPSVLSQQGKESVSPRSGAAAAAINSDFVVHRFCWDVWNCEIEKLGHAMGRDWVILLEYRRE